MNIAGTEIIEYHATLHDGTRAELAIFYVDVANYSTARAGKVSTSESSRYYDEMLPFGSIQGGVLEMMHHLEQDKQLAAWNGGKPIQWEPYNG